MGRVDVHRTLALALCAAVIGCSSGGTPALVPGGSDAKFAAPLARIADPAANGSAGDALVRPYRAVEGGRFELTRALRFETALFGPVVLTPGYRSDGSSSPIADVEGSRLAGFLHDALYAASGHLRFPGGTPMRWTREEADGAYCDELARRGVPAWHASANCAGVRRLPHIAASWDRLAPKREARWAQWAANPPGAAPATVVVPAAE